MKFAITRKISASMEQCELTHFQRTPIDVALARQQHSSYEQALVALGLEVHSLPEEPDLPDSVFVEDTALVFDELAIMTYPGAESRRREVGSVAAALQPHRTLYYIQPPGTLDGGDVLCIGKQVWVGLSGRSNQAAIEQMRVILAPLGYSVTGVPVTGCLHLKSAVTQVGENTVLLNPAWVDPALWAGMEILAVDPAEEYAANALYANGAIIYPTAFPATRRMLEEHGIRVVAVDASEVQKAEGAVTCCSLVFA